MKIRNKTTGEVLEVMDGTNFAKSAYEVVNDKASKKDTNTDNAADNNTMTKKVTPKSTTK